MKGGSMVGIEETQLAIIGSSHPAGLSQSSVKWSGESSPRKAHRLATLCTCFETHVRHHPRPPRVCQVPGRRGGGRGRVGRSLRPGWVSVDLCIHLEAL